MLISFLSLHFFLHAPKKVGGGATPSSYTFLISNFKNNVCCEKRIVAAKKKGDPPPPCCVPNKAISLKVNSPKHLFFTFSCIHFVKICTVVRLYFAKVCRYYMVLHVAKLQIGTFNLNVPVFSNTLILPIMQISIKMAVSSVLVEACLVCKHHFGICTRFWNMPRYKQ